MVKHRNKPFLVYKEPWMQGIGLNKFSTFVTEVSFFVGNPVYLEKKIVVEIIPIHLSDRLSWALGSKYDRLIYILHLNDFYFGHLLPITNNHANKRLKRKYGGKNLCRGSRVVWYHLLEKKGTFLENSFFNFTIYACISWEIHPYPV